MVPAVCRRDRGSNQAITVKRVTKFPAAMGAEVRIQNKVHGKQIHRCSNRTVAQQEGPEVSACPMLACTCIFRPLVQRASTSRPASSIPHVTATVDVRPERCICIQALHTAGCMGLQSKLQCITCDTASCLAIRHLISAPGGQGCRLQISTWCVHARVDCQLQLGTCFTRWRQACCCSSQ
jgi:hypothetical protein